MLTIVLSIQVRFVDVSAIKLNPNCNHNPRGNLIFKIIFNYNPRGNLIFTYKYIHVIRILKITSISTVNNAKSIS